jgi:antitoxin (DNA-binding transcriptional repressor) of toxin-antitoxin stability system
MRRCRPDSPARGGPGTCEGGCHARPIAPSAPGVATIRPDRKRRVVTAIVRPPPTARALPEGQPGRSLRFAGPRGARRRTRRATGRQTRPSPQPWSRSPCFEHTETPRQACPELRRRAQGRRGDGVMALTIADWAMLDAEGGSGVPRGLTEGVPRCTLLSVGFSEESMKISISEARRRLPELVRRLRKGGGAPVQITVHEEVVAELRAVQPEPEPGAAARKLLDLMRRLPNTTTLSNS